MIVDSDSSVIGYELIWETMRFCNEIGPCFKLRGAKGGFEMGYISHMNTLGECLIIFHCRRRVYKTFVSIDTNTANNKILILTFISLPCKEREFLM